MTIVAGFDLHKAQITFDTPKPRHWGGPAGPDPRHPRLKDRGLTHTRASITIARKPSRR